MKNKFKYLTLISLKRKIKSKWFVIANIIMAAAIICIANIDSIINYFGGDFNEKTNIYVIDNTNSYDVFKTNLDYGFVSYEKEDLYNVTVYDGEKDTLVEKIKTDENEADSIILVFTTGEEVLEVEMITNDYVENVTMSIINMAVNSTKTYLATQKYNIDDSVLNDLVGSVSINRVILDESKDSVEENMSAIMTTIFPIFILPFFMLVIFLVQMIGAEVNDEKSTKGMEIIISNVSPKVHFFSKCLAGNVFVILQSVLLILYLVIALFIKSSIESNNIFNTVNSLLSGVVTAEFISSLKYVIPVILILMLLSFVAYSLLAGILASMTTNTEDFQQIQTPIMILNLIGYYLAIMAGAFKGSLLIKILGYVPFISAILSPSLLVMGEFTYIDVIISMALVGGVIFLLIRYGLRVYKVGILNYSTGNLWKKIVKALKTK